MYVSPSAGFDASRMTEILLATNVRNLLFSLLMYFRTVLLSAQKQDSSSLSTHTATAAAGSSRCGIVTGLGGATLAFPKWNETCTSPRSFCYLKQFTVPYPAPLASAKPCKVMWHQTPAHLKP